MKVKPLKVGNVMIGGKRPAFILGPCVIESHDLTLQIAELLP